MLGHRITGWEEAHIKNNEIEEDSNNVQDESNDRLQAPHYCLGIFQLDRQVCPLPAKYSHHLPAASRQTTSNSHVSCNSRMQCNAAAQHLHKSRLQAGRMMTLDCWREQCLYNRTQTRIATTAYVTALCISCVNITDDSTQKEHTPPLDINSCAAWLCDVNDDVGQFWDIT